MPDSLSNKVVDLQAEILLKQVLWHGYFSMNFAKIQGHLSYRTPPCDHFWYLENLASKVLILNRFVHSINNVGTLHLMSRNSDFIF